MRIYLKDTSKSAILFPRSQEDNTGVNKKTLNFLPILISKPFVWTHKCLIRNPKHVATFTT
jgi:hypothetical protein